MARTLAYAEIPTEPQWRKDSSVSLAIRSKDQILTRIDALIAAYHRNRHDPKSSVIACDLFFTLDYWLKIYKKNYKMENARAPAIQALYECVVHVLCGIFNCKENTLPRELELMFGRELSAHGVAVDVLNSLGENQKAFYLENRAELELFKLRFKNGKAYQWRWWDRSRGGLVLANSKTVYSPRAGIGTTAKNFGYFVMSMSRDIYMMRHGPIRGTDYRIFHSTYFAGGTVMTAGSILIENGHIKAIGSDSGHYMPTNANMFALLQTLAMVGVRLNKIEMLNHKKEPAGKASDFFKQNADWSKLWGLRNKTVVDNMAAFSVRPKPPGLSRAPVQPRSPVRPNGGSDGGYNYN